MTSSLWSSKQREQKPSEPEAETREHIRRFCFRLIFFGIAFALSKPGTQLRARFGWGGNSDDLPILCVLDGGVDWPVGLAFSCQSRCRSQTVERQRGQGRRLSAQAAERRWQLGQIGTRKSRCHGSHPDWLAPKRQGWS